MKIICWLIGLWNTLRTSGGYNFVWVSGHDFVEEPPASHGKQENVQVLVCQRCGYISCGWR